MRTPVAIKQCWAKNAIVLMFPHKLFAMDTNYIEML